MGINLFSLNNNFRGFRWYHQKHENKSPRNAYIARDISDLLHPTVDIGHRNILVASIKTT
jgi:hypothetical protein